MTIEENVQIVKDFFAAIGSYNEHDLLALVSEDIEWIIPGDGWPLAARNWRLCLRRRPKRWK
jgi:ketosteroid isomerase-like protein